MNLMPQLAAAKGLGDALLEMIDQRGPHRDPVVSRVDADRLPCLSARSH
jgi:hypothetical protein